MTDMTCNCTFMTIAENINVKVEAKIEALVAEKFKYITGQVDALGVDITNIVRVVDGLAAFVDANAPTLDALLRQAESSVDDEPVAPEPVAPVSVPIVSNFMDMPTLIWKIEDEGHKTRDYMKHLAIVMALFIFVMTIVVVSAVYVTVYMLTEPEPCESVPGQCPAASLPSKWDALTACARIMLTNEEY